MSKLSSITKNTGSMLLATLFRMGTSFVLMLFVARVMGATGMGQFSLTISVFWTFQTIANMGLQPLIIREVAKHPSKAHIYLTNVSVLGFFVSIILGLIMIAFVTLARYDSEIIQSTYWMAGALVISTLIIIFQSIYIAFERAELVLFGMIAENLIRLGLGLLLLYNGFGLVSVMSVFFFAPLLSLFVYFALMYRLIPLQGWSFDLDLFKWVVRQIPTFAGISFFNSLYGNLVIILLSKMQSIEAVGYFSAAMRLVSMVRLILQSYKAAIQPIAAKTFLESVAHLKAFTEDTFRHVLLIVLPVCFGALLVSDKLVILLFGEEFLISGSLLRLGIWSLLPYALTMVLASILIATNNQKIDLRINAQSLVVQLILSVTLIYFFSYWGAVISMVSSRSIFLLLQLQFIYKHLFKLNLIHISFKYLISAGSMVLILQLLHNLHVIPQILAGIVVYFLVLASMRGISGEDIRWVLKK